MHLFSLNPDFPHFFRNMCPHVKPGSLDTGMLLMNLQPAPDKSPGPGLRVHRGVDAPFPGHLGD